MKKNGGVYMYDNAIVETLRRMCVNNNIYITPPSNVIRTVAQVTSDSIKLPMISLSRTGITLLPKNHFAKFDGNMVSIDEETMTSKRLQMIPIRINYLLDVWAATQEECDDIVRELCFYFENHPTMKVLIPYDLNIKHVFNILLDSNIDDNSDIVDHINRGEYFRQTMSLYTDDAYLWKSSTRKATELDIEFIYDFDEENKEVGQDGTSNNK